MASKHKGPTMTERQRAEVLRDHVLKTWNPPLMGMGCVATVAQTSVMQTLAFVYGEEFVSGLTFNQTAAINGGLKLMNEVIGNKPAEVPDAE